MTVARASNRAFADRQHGGWQPVALLKAEHLVWSLWRWIRVQKPISLILGPQYRRSRDRIEIDITYRCNLGCLNCNRSCRQAPEPLDIELGRVCGFVDTSIGRSKRWRSIRVLGGEPTLHPRFQEIICELRRYAAWFPDCSIEVVTNGCGPHVNAQLAALPGDIWVENSAKSGPLQTGFRPFNLAPCDDPKLIAADFSNGCEIMESCGIGLGPTGYFPCAVAAGIDRIVGWSIGRQRLPEDDDEMADLLRVYCAMCGRFHDGHFVPRGIRKPLETELISATWRREYERWRRRRGI